MARKQRMNAEGNMVYEIKLAGLKERGSWGLRANEKEDYYSTQMAPFVSENFSDDLMTSQGLPDGDQYHREMPNIPLHEQGHVDLFGNPISAEKFEKMDFHPNDADFIVEKEEEDVSFYRAPIWAGGRVSFYRNPHGKTKIRGRIVNRYF